MHTANAVNPYAPFAAMANRASLANLVSLARRAEGEVSQSAPPGGALAATLEGGGADEPDEPDPSWVGGSMHSVTSAGGLYSQLLAQQNAPGGALWSPARQRSGGGSDRIDFEDDRSSTVCTNVAAAATWTHTRHTCHDYAQGHPGAPAPSSATAWSLLNKGATGVENEQGAAFDTELDISAGRTPAQVGSWFGGIINLPGRKNRDRPFSM